VADSFKKEIEDIAREIVTKFIDKKIVGFLPRGRYKGKTGFIVITVEKSQRIVTVYNSKKS